jgi:hypothetical protein
MSGARVRSYQFFGEVVFGEFVFFDSFFHSFFCLFLFSLLLPLPLPLPLPLLIFACLSASLPLCLSASLSLWPMCLLPLPLTPAQGIPDCDLEVLDMPAGRPEDLLITALLVPPVCIRPSGTRVHVVLEGRDGAGGQNQ